MDFNVDMFVGRRTQLLARLQNDEAVLLPAATTQYRSGDTAYPFRQDSDFYYLTGFNEPDAVVLLRPNDQPFILFNLPDDPKVTVWEGARAGQVGGVEIFGADAAHDLADIDKVLPDLLKGYRKLYYPYGRYDAFDERVKGWVATLKSKIRQGVTVPDTLCDIVPLIHEMRLIKSSEEIALIQQGMAITVAAHKRAMAMTQPGVNESEVEAELQHEFMRHGSRHVAYPPIVGGGNNSCILHYTANDATLQDGDVLLIDAGCEFANYATDVTRTFPVSGQFTKAQRAIYEIVLAAQEAGIVQVRPGNPWHKIQEAMVEVITKGLVDLGLLQGDVATLIEQKAYQKFYMHSSGHWLGLDTHDVGAYRIEGAWRPLEAGMVLTVEPGIYIPEGAEGVDKQYWRIGVRIEDDVLVTDAGCDVLSAALPKSVGEVEAMVGRPPKCG